MISWAVCSWKDFAGLRNLFLFWELFTLHLVSANQHHYYKSDKCTHGYHVASLIKPRMLISITAPNQQNFTSVSGFSHQSELNDLQVCWARIGSARRAAVHVARRRGGNFGRALEGFTKFLIETLAMASGRLVKNLFFAALCHFIHVQVRSDLVLSGEF